MTISKKSTQGKRSLAGTLDDEESQVNRSKDKLAKPRNDLTRVERGHSNIRSTSAGQSRPIPEKGKEKTNSRAAGGTDEEENGTFFEGPGDKRGNLSREKMTISKKSTQGKRSLAGTLDDEESQVNRSKDKLAKPRNDLTRVERGHSNIRSTSAGQSRPIPEKGKEKTSSRAAGTDEDENETSFEGPGSTQENFLREKKAIRKKKTQGKRLEKEHDVDAGSPVHRELEVNSSEERRRQVQREWSSAGVFSDCDDAVTEGESSHEVDLLPSSQKLVGKKPILANRSCCCSEELLQLVKVLDNKVDKLLKTNAALRGTQVDSDEPELLQIVCNNKYTYIGNGYVMLRERYISVEMYTSRRPARYISQMAKAVFGVDTLSRSRLNACRGGDYMALDYKLVECIFRKFLSFRLSEYLII
ncbi:Hypothetical predicted protein [Cloeon dipterum]|uniref:Uncharacterized protein n=1 Tax=Cloeon dipterum TaxID=197152 RepID=A0A8S1DW59_9INSE|nr:Hypothetical predicted protein [Cloeon dipterum]